MSREYTDMLLEMLDDGVLTEDMVIMACLRAMSEDDVREMMDENGFSPDNEWHAIPPYGYEEGQDLWSGDDIFDPHF